jgi:predicted AAA+ superfamily ATPase
VSETLTGRIERFELWSFSQGELTQQREHFVDRLFADQIDLAYRTAMTKRDYLEHAAAGGFAEAVNRQGARRGAWFDSYVETVVEREAPGVAASPRTAELPRLLRLIAARHGSVLNVSDLARDAGIPQRSVHRYLEVLEAVFLVRRLPAWSANLSQREIRTPKVYLTDSGLASHLRGIDPTALARPEIALGADGPILEGFVYGEILRQGGWSMIRPQLMHYRDRNHTEVDLVLEDRQRRVAAIEVKAGVDLGPKDLRPLTSLRDQLGERFVAGVVLNTGPEALRLSDRIYGVPISALWDYQTPPDYNRLADRFEDYAILAKLGRDGASGKDVGGGG